MVDREKHRRASPNNNQRRHDMVVHCPTCNEHRTKEGVIVGGERLWQEMLDTIHCEMANRHDLTIMEDNDDDDNDELKDITISLLGNSLGGLYSRYALAKLMEHVQVIDNTDGDGEEPTLILDGKYRLHLNIFCSTASPHLGISKHTYIPIPRSAEIGAAYTMGESGKDLYV
jgi:hypothetical protein